MSADEGAPPAKRPHNETIFRVPSASILGVIDIACALLVAPPDPPTSLEARVQLALAACAVYALPGVVGIRFRDAARMRVQPDADAPDDVYFYAPGDAPGALRCLGHIPEDTLDAIGAPSFAEIFGVLDDLEAALAPETAPVGS